MGDGLGGSPDGTAIDEPADDTAPAAGFRDAPAGGEGWPPNTEPRATNPANPTTNSAITTAPADERRLRGWACGPFALRLELPFDCNQRTSKVCPCRQRSATRGSDVGRRWIRRWPVWAFGWITRPSPKAGPEV